MSKEEMLEKLLNLKAQAVQEKSHYYVASVCRDVIAFIEAERARARILEDALEFYAACNEWDYGHKADQALLKFRAASGEGDV